MVGGSGMSISWLALTVLLVLSSCSWMLAGGRVCSLSAGYFSLRTVTVSAERKDGSTPGARVTWNTTAPPECVASVTVKFRSIRTGSLVTAYTTTNTSETEVIMTGLQCATTYYIKVVVTGVSSLGILENDEVPVFVNVGDIPRPVRVRAKATSDNTSIRVSWEWLHESELLCLNSLRVEYRNEFEGVLSLMVYTVDNTTATSVTLSNLQCNTRYIISVYAFGGTTGKRSAQRVVFLPARAPPTPTEVTAQVMNASSVKVAWQWTSSGLAPNCFSTTRVTYHSEGGGETSLQLMDPAANETTLTDLPQCNTKYIITVVSIAGEHRRESVAMTVFSPLQGPWDLSAAVLSPTSVYLTWVAPCDTQQYHIYYRGTCGTYVDEGSLDINHQEYIFDELLESVNYTFIVNQTGYGGGRVLSTGPVYAMTFTTVPSGAPQSVEVMFLQPSKVFLSWREVPCVQQNGPTTGYMVRYYATCGADRDMQQTKSVVTTGSIIDGLTLNTEYAFQVAAVNANGTGPFSEAIILGGAPQLVVVSPVNSTTITVSWSEVQCFNGSGAVTHYLVQYHSMCGGTVQNIATDDTVKTISDLTPNIAMYTFQVAAVVTSQMIGPFSNPTNTSVLGTTPMCPEDSDGLSSSTDPGLLAGVAVFLIVLVLAAACIVVLFMWWRYTRIKNQRHRLNTCSVHAEHALWKVQELIVYRTTMKECSAYGVTDQGCGKLEEANVYEEIDLGDAKWEEAHIYELPQ